MKNELSVFVLFAIFFAGTNCFAADTACPETLAKDSVINQVLESADNYEEKAFDLKVTMDQDLEDLSLTRVLVSYRQLNLTEKGIPDSIPMVGTITLDSGCKVKTYWFNRAK